MNFVKESSLKEKQTIMKKLLLLLTLPLLLISCNKEDIQPNGGKKGVTLRLMSINPGCNQLYLRFIYTDIYGVQHGYGNVTNEWDGQVEDVDTSYTYSVYSAYGIVLYGPNGSTITDNISTTYNLYIDNTHIDYKNTSEYSYTKQ
jgi:hypothetical protein